MVIAKYMNKIVIGTFHDEIETELKTKYPELLRGAPSQYCRSVLDDKRRR